jgi:hypothetical protein
MTIGQPQGVISTNANLTGLQTLPAGSISATASTVHQAGPAGADLATTVTITNSASSAAAFFLRADVRRGTAAGQQLSGDNELQSSIWQGNHITLFPMSTANEPSAARAGPPRADGAASGSRRPSTTPPAATGPAQTRPGLTMRKISSGACLTLALGQQRLRSRGHRAGREPGPADAPQAQRSTRRGRRA